MDRRDPTNEGLYPGNGVYCPFCQQSDWGMEHMKKTPTDDWICPNCRIKCDYCEQYFPTNEITRVADGKACSDCLFDHALEPLDKIELYDTLSTILRL